MKWSAPGSWSGTVGPLRWLESCLAEYSCQWNVGCRPQHRFATRGQCLLGSVGGVWHMAGSANRPHLVGLQITVTVVIGLFHCALCLRLVADKRHFQLHWDNLQFTSIWVRSRGVGWNLPSLSLLQGVLDLRLGSVSSGDVSQFFFFFTITDLHTITYYVLQDVARETIASTWRLKTLNSLMSSSIFNVRSPDVCQCFGLFWPFYFI